MTEQAALVNFTEENAKAALIDARGDVFVASQQLGVTALRLDRAIRVSAKLQATVSEVQSRSESPEAYKESLGRIESAVSHRLALYRVVGLDSLAELATMPIDENSAMAQVRLAAAARLAGSPEVQAGSGEIADTLRALNAAYHENAPRIRIVRERISVEMNGPHPEVEIPEASLQHPAID